jgi:PEGA domain-containing protein
MAAVQIKTRPKGARVAVNDRALGKPAPLEFSLEPGNYDIA